MLVILYDTMSKYCYYLYYEVISFSYSFKTRYVINVINVISSVSVYYTLYSLYII